MVDFLELPGELRNKIYRYCFVLINESCVKVLVPHVRKSDKFSRMTIGPLDVTSQLLAVCRQVYLEAMPILYSENQFRFVELQDFTRFRQVIGEKSAACVTNIIIAVYWQHIGPKRLNSTIYDSFPGLKKLCLQRRYRYYDTLPRSSELQPGTIVSANWFCRLDSNCMPDMDRVTANWLLEKGLEVMMKVLFCGLRNGDHSTNSNHCFRLIPTPKTSELNSSQIGQNYDLEFVMSEPIL